MIVVVMGVSGSGKTTVGQLLAEQLNWGFVDADAYHPEANVAKMAHGIALTDQDRQPWLASLRAAMTNWLAGGENVVLACSALKESYRCQLGKGRDIRLVYLKGNYELIASRLSARLGHFATESILADQFANLEEPLQAVVVDVQTPPPEIVRRIRTALGLS